MHSGGTLKRKNIEALERAVKRANREGNQEMADRIQENLDKENEYKRD